MQCPRCNSEKVIKAGRGINTHGIYQRYQCRNCAKIIKGETIKKLGKLEGGDNKHD